MPKQENGLSQFVLEERLTRIEKVAALRTKSLVVVLDNVHNFHNISAVIRSAEAFGVNDIYLVGDEFEYNSGISLGTERWVELARIATAVEAIVRLKSNGFKIVILEPELLGEKRAGVKCLPVFELPFAEKLALVFGNEKRGVGEEFAKVADYTSYIPMYGFVDSFNISVAAGICLFCSSVSGTTAKRNVSVVSEGECEELKFRWLKNSVRGSEAILKELKQREN
jgi:tRNA (guanosine-2'-O-)-methyltransferase